MKKNYLTLLLITLISSCGNKNTTNQDIVKGHFFFENSKRSTVNKKSKKAKGIAKLNSCTGFFLKNKDNKNYVVSASHCFNFKATDWCENSGFVSDYFENKLLKCIQVVVGDGTHDTVIFEIEASDRDRSLDFTLADFDIRKNLGLAMLGFPGDIYNPRKELKLTEHCKVQKSSTKTVYPFREVKDDKVFLHNCSTYGGNSGGPMYVQGTRVAIGLPDAYKPNYYINNRADSSTQGVLLKAFVDEFRPQIKELGINLTRNYPIPKAEFLTEGYYSSFRPEMCHIKFTEIVYNTNPYPTHINVSFVGDNCIPNLKYTCDARGTCKDQKNITGLKLIDLKSFDFFLISRPKTKTTFKRL